MVASPARGQLNRKTNVSLPPFAPENLVSRDRFDRPVPRRPAHSSTTPRLNLVLIQGIPPDFRVGPHIYRQLPSGQFRVYRVTQLRTDGVYSRESASTGPVILKVVRVTSAAFSSFTVNQCLCTSLFPTPTISTKWTCVIRRFLIDALAVCRRWSVRYEGGPSCPPWRRRPKTGRARERRKRRTRPRLLLGWP